MVRMNRGTHTGYLLFIFKDNPAASGIYQWNGFSPLTGHNFQLLQAFNPSRIQAGDTWGLYANGASLDVKLNGVSVGAPFPITDPDFASGDVGFEIFGNQMAVDAWEGGDITGPGTPQIALAWTPSTDDIGVAAYLVERCQGVGCSNFAQIASVATASFNNTPVAAGTSYSYRVRARDAAGNLSGYSNTATAATPLADAAPPTAPPGLTATVASNTQINLAWGASTDNVAVTGYMVERCQGAGCTSFTQIATTAATVRTYNNTGLTQGTTYIYRVRATDAAANLSTYSNNATATTTAPDSTPPSAPANLTAAGNGSGQIKLTWDASTDNIGVTAYLVQRCLNSGCTNFTQIASVTTTTYTNTGLTPQNVYSYRVRARDAANNLSAFSNTVVAVVPGIGFVQSRTVTPNPQMSSLSATYSSAQRAGDLNVVIIGWNDSVTLINTVTDTKGNIYTPIVGTVRPGPTEGGGMTQVIYYAKNIAAAPANGNTVTVTFNQPATLIDMRILEYGGVDPVNPVDGYSFNQGDSAASDTGLLTTTNANDLLVAANMVMTSTGAFATGFTSRGISAIGDIVEDRIVSTVGTYQASNLLNGSGGWLMQMVAFRAAP